MGYGLIKSPIDYRVTISEYVSKENLLESRHVMCYKGFDRLVQRWLGA